MGAAIGNEQCEALGKTASLIAGPAMVLPFSYPSHYMLSVYRSHLGIVAFCFQMEKLPQVSWFVEINNYPVICPKTPRS